MDINGTHYRTIWLEDDGWSIGIIDQTLLPHEFSTICLTSLEETCVAIETMQVRGAPLIGVTAAHGLALAIRSDSSDDAMRKVPGTPLYIYHRYTLLLRELLSQVVKGVPKGVPGTLP